MIFPQKSQTVIPSIFMLGFFGVCLIISLMTIVNKHSEIFEKIYSDQKEVNILNGQWASKFEKSFEKNILVRPLSDSTWGSLSYALFKTGKDSVITGKNGWLFTKEEFENISTAEKNEARFLDIVRHVNQTLSANDISLVVAVIPAKVRIYPEHAENAALPTYREDLYARFLENLKDENIIAPNLVTLFKANKNVQTLYLKQDTHWTPLGAQATANAISKMVNPENYESTAYNLKASGSKTIEGDLEKYIPTGALKPWLNKTDETVRQYKLEKEKITEKKSLFDDEVIPVALVGTSYSAIADWQFEEMLKYELQADVVNMADEGKGPLAPMADFLDETDLKNSTIKLVVWEIPERFIPVDYSDVEFSSMKVGG